MYKLKFNSCLINAVDKRVRTRKTTVNIFADGQEAPIFVGEVSCYRRDKDSRTVGQYYAIVKATKGGTGEEIENILSEWFDHWLHDRRRKFFTSWWNCHFTANCSPYFAEVWINGK